MSANKQPRQRVIVEGSIQTYERSNVEAENSGRERRRERRDSVTLAMGFITLIFVVIVAVISKYQLDTSEKTFDLTRQQMVYSERPWLGLVTPADPLKETLFEPVKQGPIFWHIRIKNFGNSPAMQTQLHVKVWVVPGDKLDWKSIQSQIEALNLLKDVQPVVFNGVEVPSQDPSDIALAQGAVDQINDKGAKVILGGRVLYHDEFNSEVHETTFCVFYLPAEAYKAPGFDYCPIRTIAD